VRRPLNDLVGRSVAVVPGISMLALAQQPAGHLPVVGEYGAVLSYSVAPAAPRLVATQPAAPAEN
jgi:hypothetical protein